MFIAIAAMGGGRSGVGEGFSVSVCSEVAPTDRHPELASLLLRIDCHQPPLRHSATEAGPWKGRHRAIITYRLPPPQREHYIP